jgi:DNA (cytosine-5)-methyltransferase 1
VPVTHAGERRANSPEEPLPTITGANRGELAAVIAHLAHGFKGEEVRASSPDDPLPTIHAGGLNCAIVAPTLMPHYGKSVASDVDAPCPTITAGGQGKQALCAAFLAKHFGGVVGHTPDRPIGTVTAVDHHSVVDTKLAPFTVQRYGEFPNQKPRCGTVEAPLNTVTATNNSGNLVAANLVHFNHGGKQSSGCDEPTRTVTAGGGHASLVYSFLVKYFGQGVGVLVDAPCPTVTTKDRFGLVFVYVEGEPYVIVDIGMRMLRPKELARAQGFSPATVMTGTATSQVARIGNSVPPDLAFAVANAQVAEVAVAA